MKKSGKKRELAGYTLVEVLVASVILMIGISAAASLSLTMVSQEEANYRIARALNVFENGARMFQLGMEPPEIYGTATALIPDEPAINGVIVFTPADYATADISLEGYEMTMTMNSVSDEGAWSEGTWTGGSDTSSPQRVSTLRVYRPMTR